MARKHRREHNDFLSQFLDGSPPDPSKLEKSVVNHDKWDEEAYQAIFDEMVELRNAEDRLTDVVDTGGSAFADTFYELVKADPTLRDAKEVRPSHQINHIVMGEALELKELQELRTYSTGDEVAAGLACIAMEPELEILFDKVKEQQKLADQIEQQMQQMIQQQQEIADLDKMMQEALEGGNQEEAQNYQEQKALIEAAQEVLQGQLQQNIADFEQQMGEAMPGLRAQMRAALRQGIKDAEQMENMSMAWGLEPGALHRLPADERIAMAKRLNNERFRRIAQLFGPMHRMAFAEQMRKTDHAKDEIYDVEIGNDLDRLLASELLKLGHPLLKLEFIRKFYEGELLEYKLRGTEKLAKGGIVYMEDGSGSMTGESEIWAKAVGLCLLQIAKSQRRSFYGIHFGSPGQYTTFDFRTPKDITPDRVIDFAELHFGGGTCFQTPLTVALNILTEEYEQDGKVRADMVFATDGICGVPDKWLKDFKEQQEKLGFRVYGIAIGGSPDSEPLHTICDGRVCSISDLLTGGDIRDIFRGV